jgi:hypothetical protein
MHRLAESEILGQRHEEIRREVVVGRPTGTAHGKREAVHYVVRDLSWELARYLDAEGFSASALTTSKSVRGHHGRTPEEGWVGS